jgi:hypothetical protein
MLEADGVPGVDGGRVVLDAVRALQGVQPDARHAHDG